METEPIKVIFKPSDKEILVPAGTKLSQAIDKAGIKIFSSCGGNGTCGKCRIKVVSGACPPSQSCIKFIRNDLIKSGHRLACQISINAPLIIEIPFQSSSGAVHTITNSGLSEDIKPDTAVTKRFFELPQPTKDEPLSDMSRFQRQFENVYIPYSILRNIPGFLRKNNWKGTAIIYKNELIALEKDDTHESCYGVAFDVGTTTIVGELVNLNDGKQCYLSSCLNPQSFYGDDVISRIQYIRESGGLAKLQKAVIDAVNKLIEKLCERSRTSFLNIYEISIAGNTTMQQILCGIDPSALGVMPFVPAFESSQVFPASELGIRANPGAKVLVYGQIGGFVGGDTLACMVASRIDSWNKPVLLVDIGTNGEIVFANGNQIIATSTAAGPAFEGARISHGMRASTGAIEKIVIDHNLSFKVIKDCAPRGLCGTAIIDVTAEMLRTGLLQRNGRIVRPSEAGIEIPDHLRKRLVERSGMVDFLIVERIPLSMNESIFFTQKDVVEVQLASSAIAAGIKVLLKHAGANLKNVEMLFIAGAFGNSLCIDNAKRIGLLPQIENSKIRFIGNASLTGSKLSLLSCAHREYAETLRQKTRYLNLSLEPEFQTEFENAMMFPE